MCSPVVLLRDCKQEGRSYLSGKYLLQVEAKKKGFFLMERVERVCEKEADSLKGPHLDAE